MDRGRRNPREINPQIKNIIDELDKVKMLKDMNTKDFADENGYADIIARNSKKTLKTTQLRKFFGAIRDIEREKDWNRMEAEFYLLKPKLANAIGRNLIPKDFYELMKVCMRKVDIGSDKDKVKNFSKMVEFLEAIVAYHKYYNPKSIGGI